MGILMAVVGLIDNTDRPDFTVNRCLLLDNLGLVAFLTLMDSK